ncbi:MAG: hypothetical protein J3R72DRAFT_454015 [Linnemannia gamsii]|nr:MAG: hypothetical protein J3R72DRAFT_454015 [Linnemannia gamsii]
MIYQDQLRLCTKSLARSCFLLLSHFCFSLNLAYNYHRDYRCELIVAMQCIQLQRAQDSGATMEKPTGHHGGSQFQNFKRYLALLAQHPMWLPESFVKKSNHLHWTTYSLMDQ